jgi:hypothetical protein
MVFENPPGLHGTESGEFNTPDTRLPLVWS